VIEFDRGRCTPVEARASFGEEEVSGIVMEEGITYLVETTANPQGRRSFRFLRFDEHGLEERVVYG